MKEIFKETVEELFSVILGTENSICKIEKIKSCKNYLGISQYGTFADFYNDICRNENVKGVVYTPKEIVEYMLENSINDEDIINNPYIKILDPSCGAGNIILTLLKYLKALYLRNLDEINRKNNLRLERKDIVRHIVENNLFGIDIDELSLKVLLIELYYVAGYIKKVNFICGDFLIDNNILDENKFDIIIGNPPYIGRKAIDKGYSKKIKSIYKEIYSDKSDLSYCFFKKALVICKPSYKIAFVVSRYFLESLNGSDLRDYILTNSNIYKITDFYGARPFKNIGIDPVIIFLTSQSNGDISVDKVDKECRLKDNFREKITTFSLNSNKLNSEPWRIQPEEKLRIIDKIENKCETSLKDKCDFFQGIITGCDKAFIISGEEIKTYGIEKTLIRRWIKNSDVNREKIEHRDMFLIYADNISSETAYPNAISYIERYKDKLLKRRECVSGIRKWYQLQWGRSEEIFTKEKIIFPYKSNKNIFSKSSEDFFSADIYALVKKENANITYEYLSMILNSPIYEFYFKCFGKKMGREIYEYYPNNVERLMIPINDHEAIKNEEDLYEYFNITEEEKQIILNSVK